MKYKSKLSKDTNASLPRSLLDQLDSNYTPTSKELDARFKFRGYTQTTLNRKQERKKKRIEKKQNKVFAQQKKKQVVHQLKHEESNKKTKSKLNDNNTKPITDTDSKNTKKYNNFSRQIQQTETTMNYNISKQTTKVSVVTEYQSSNKKALKNKGNDVVAKKKQLEKFAKNNPELYSLLSSRNLLDIGDEKSNARIGQDGSTSGPYTFTQQDYDEDDKMIAMYAKKLGIKKKNIKKLPKSLVEDGLGDLFDDLDMSLNDVGDEDEVIGEDNDISELDVMEEDDIGDLEDIADEVGKEDQEEEFDEDEFLSNTSYIENDDEGSFDDDENEDDEMMEQFDSSEQESTLDDENETSNEDYGSEIEQQEKDEGNQEPSSNTISSTATSSKYIPPHLRANMVSSESKDKPSDQVIRLKKQMQSLLNKLSEGNIETIILSLEEVFMNSSRRDFIDTLTELLLNATADPQLQLPDSFAQLHAAFIMAVAQVLAGQEFAASFLETLFTKFQINRIEWKQLHDDFSVEEEIISNKSKTCTNLITLLSYLYNFEMIACLLVYDIVRLCVDDLNDLNVEVLLRLLRICGQGLRSDDPTSLKDIVLAVQSAVAKMDQAQLSSRCKFMIETITDLKNNKKKTKGSASGSGLVGGPVTNVNLERLKKFLNSLGKKRTLKVVEPLRITVKDFEESDTKGKWWLVGAAWVGNQANASNHSSLSVHDGSNTNIQSIVHNDKDSSLHKKLAAMAKAQGMNTDIRRSIFIILMSSEDCVDAYEKLMRLNLKDKQEREIVKVIMHCCGQEKLFNPYYAFVGQKFCEYSYSFKVTFQFAFWDFFKELTQSGELNGPLVRKISHLAKMMAILVKVETMSLSILRVLNFTALSKSETLFNQIMLLSLFSPQGKERHVAIRKISVLFQKSLHVLPTTSSSNMSSKKRKEFMANNETLKEGISFFVNQFIIKPLNNQKSGGHIISLVATGELNDVKYIANHIQQYLSGHNLREE